MNQTLKKLMDSAKIKIPGVTDQPLQTADMIKPVEPTLDKASGVASSDIGGRVTQEAMAMVAPMSELQDSQSPQAVITPTASTNPNITQKKVASTVFRIAPFYINGLNTLTADPSEVIFDPNMWKAALMQVLSNTLGSSLWLKRNSVSLLQTSWDSSGNITIGAGSVASLTWKYGVAGALAGSVPALGILIQIQALNKLDGASTVTVGPVDGQANIPTISAQLGQSTVFGYLFIPFSRVAVQLNETQGASIVAGNGILTSTLSAVAVATDKYVTPESILPGTSICTIAGVNAVINAIIVTVDTFKAVSVNQVSQMGGSINYGQAIVNTASKYFQG